MHNTLCVDSCPSGFHSDEVTGKCEVGNPVTTYTEYNPEVAFFPFLIIAILFLLVSLIGKLKNRKSMFLTNTIALWGILEFFVILFQAVFAI
jgi:hypothetical protein